MIHTQGTRWRLGPAAGLGSLLLIAAACTSGTSSATQSASASASASTSASASASEDQTGQKIVISTTTNFGGVDEITIKAGEPLTVSNASGVPHTFTEGENGQAAANPVVNETIQPGSDAQVTFPDKGDFHVTCLFHQAMNLEVHVQ
ncbi:MAG TPA: plastocyanin/azurin family copper-binding protein [Candidatus Limnocylindria bacterium]